MHYIPCTLYLQVAGDPAVSSQLSKFMGVRNGIDVDIWDPASDPSLPRRFGAEDLVEGKAACREALRQRLGLTGWGDRPMVGVVSRLTAQKGAAQGNLGCRACAQATCNVLSIGWGDHRLVDVVSRLTAQRSAAQNAIGCMC